jgi:DsbC/DsbD-like thiol-disulfide interchange protein
MPLLALILTLTATAPQQTDTQHLILKLSSSAAAVAPGGRVSLVIAIAPKPKMHVYAPQQKTYIPVSITLAPTSAFRAPAPVFPAAEKYFFAPLKETQLVYSKPFRIVQHVTVASASTLRDAGHTAGSPITIAGTLRYQACDDAICYMPKEVPLSWTIAVKKSPIQ